MFITKEKHDQMVSELADVKAANETFVAEKQAHDAEVQRLTEENATLTARADELQQSNEALKAENETLKTASKAVDPKITELDAQIEQATQLVSELQTLKNDWKPAARAASDGKIPKAEGAVDLERVKEVMKIQNEK